MRFIRIALLLLLIWIAFSLYVATRKTERWAVYYGNALPVETFASYDLLVFDRDGHPPLAPLKAQHKTLLGYLSLGEAETYRNTFQMLKDKQWILDTDSAWKGNPMVDGRKPEWSAYVLDSIIPAMLRNGFDGIMIDTTDSVLWLENHDPVRYAGLVQAEVTLIKRIRARYPHLKIMLNRGFDLLPQVAGSIDMFLAESIYTNWENTVPPVGLVKPDVYAQYVNLLHETQKHAPLLKIYTLDYWQPKDSTTIASIYAIQRQQGFIPYVTAPAIQTIVPEPR